MPYSMRPPRYPTHIPVVITSGGFAQSGTIVDINAFGACLEGVEGVTRDDQIVLRGAVESSVATVRWYDDNRSGVYFEHPIPPQQLAMLRLRGFEQPRPPGPEIATAI